MSVTKEEYWLRGPIEGVSAWLQPVAHALLQAQEEIHEALTDFDVEHLWERPHGVASVGFHLQHIPGVLDRLFSYAAGNALSRTQLKYLSEEGLELPGISLSSLIAHLDAQIATSIRILKDADESSLTESRTVGRRALPSTVLGLYMHAAEHTMRHTGQLLVTSRFFKKTEDEDAGHGHDYR